MKVYSWNQTDETARALAEHALLVFPTDTVYGVGVRYGDLKDLERLRTIKHRPETKPIPVMCSSIAQAEQIAVIPDAARKIMEKLLPGALTLILPVREDVNPAWVNGGNTVAIRIPGHPQLLEMIEKCGAPCMVSSANVSGEPAALTLQEAQSALPLADGFIDGTCRQGQASTIADCTGEEIRILRPGPVSLEDIQQALAC